MRLVIAIALTGIIFGHACKRLKKEEDTRVKGGEESTQGCQLESSIEEIKAQKESLYPLLKKGVECLDNLNNIDVTNVDVISSALQIFLTHNMEYVDKQFDDFDRIKENACKPIVVPYPEDAAQVQNNAVQIRNQLAGGFERVKGNLAQIAKPLDILVGACEIKVSQYVKEYGITDNQDIFQNIFVNNPPYEYCDDTGKYQNSFESEPGKENTSLQSAIGGANNFDDRTIVTNSFCNFDHRVKQNLCETKWDKSTKGDSFHFEAKTAQTMISFALTMKMRNNLRRAITGGNDAKDIATKMGVYAYPKQEECKAFEVNKDIDANPILNAGYTYPSDAERDYDFVINNIKNGLYHIADLKLLKETFGGYEFINEADLRKNLDDIWGMGCGTMMLEGAADNGPVENFWNGSNNATPMLMWKDTMKLLTKSPFVQELVLNTRAHNPGKRENWEQVYNHICSDFDGYARIRSTALGAEAWELHRHIYKEEFGAMALSMIPFVGDLMGLATDVYIASTKKMFAYYHLFGAKLDYELSAGKSQEERTALHLAYRNAEQVYSIIKLEVYFVAAMNGLAIVFMPYVGRKLVSGTKLAAKFAKNVGSSVTSVIRRALMEVTASNQTALAGILRKMFTAGGAKLSNEEAAIFIKEFMEGSLEATRLAAEEGGDETGANVALKFKTFLSSRLESAVQRVMRNMGAGMADEVVDIIARNFARQMQITPALAKQLLIDAYKISPDLGDDIFRIAYGTPGGLLKSSGDDSMRHNIGLLIIMLKYFQDVENESLTPEEVFANFQKAVADKQVEYGGEVVGDLDTAVNRAANDVAPECHI